MSNAFQAAWGHAEADAARIAVRGAGEPWTHARLRERAAAVAGRLIAAGVRPGDRVLLVAPSVPAFAGAYHGIHAAGAVAVTANTMSTRRELEYLGADAGVSLILAWHEIQPAPQEAARAVGPVLVAGRRAGRLLVGGRDRRSGAARRRRRRRHPLHLGHDRPAEGRPAHARQPDRLRGDLRRRPRGDVRRSRRHRPATVPCVRPGGHDGDAAARRRLVVAAGPLRSGRPPRHAAPGPADRDGGRPDNVERDAADAQASVGARGLRGAARGRLRWCRDARRHHARLRATLRLRDPGGLRSLGEHRRRHVQRLASRAQALLRRRVAARAARSRSATPAAPWCPWGRWASSTSAVRS